VHILFTTRTQVKMLKVHPAETKTAPEPLTSIAAAANGKMN
jgi:hypothetical protein